MSAHVSNQDFGLLTGGRLPHYFKDEAEQVVARVPARRGLFARMAAAVAWLIEMPRRRAVLEELATLTDHELADIGLSRVDLNRVFDPAFAAERQRARASLTVGRPLTV
jgi:uncharacterized protein YjiS (DUF1127 family)